MKKLFMLFVFTTMPLMAGAGDVPPGCEVVDHAGGYVCPLAEKQIREYEEWQKIKPLITVYDLLAIHGEPSLCEKVEDFIEVDCAELKTGAIVQLQMVTFGSPGETSCSREAFTDAYFMLWKNLPCTMSDW